MIVELIADYVCFCISAIFKYMDDTGSKYTSPARYLAGPFRLGIGLKDADHIEVGVTTNKLLPQ